MSKHTPEPWHVRSHLGHTWIEAGKGKKAVQIADVADIEIDVEYDHEQTQANARMLAIAPSAVDGCAKALAALEMYGAFHQTTCQLLRSICRKAGVPA